METPTISVEISPSNNLVMTKAGAAVAASICVGAGVGGTLLVQYYGTAMVHATKQGFRSIKNKVMGLFERKPLVLPDPSVQRDLAVAQVDILKTQAQTAEEEADKLRQQLAQAHKDTETKPSVTNVVEMPQPLAKELNTPKHTLPARKEEKLQTVGSEA